MRPISFLGKPFDIYSGGEIIAWSRILDDEEFVIILNPHGTQARGANILVDAVLNSRGGASMSIVASTEEIGILNYSGINKKGNLKPVKRDRTGIHYIEIREVGPSEIVVLSNKT